jgi:hypothetical protein
MTVILVYSFGELIGVVGKVGVVAAQFVRRVFDEK